MAEDGLKLQFDYHQKLISAIKQINTHSFSVYDKSWVIPYHSLPELEEFLKVPSNIKKQVEDRMRLKIESIDNIPFNYTLRDFQVEAVHFMLERQKTFLCADMGLGKTFMSIAFSEVLQKTSSIKKTIIVCPASLKQHWANEINKFIPNKTIIIIEGEKKKRMKQWIQSSAADYIILNYELIRQPDDFNMLSTILARNCAIVLDEGSRIKNFRSKTSSVIKKLNAPYKVVLSGRPIENRPDELYSINEFLDNNILGNWQYFNNRYIVRDRWGTAKNYIRLRELHENIMKIMFRRTKKQVLDELPEMTEHNYYIHLTSAEGKDYHAITKSVQALLDSNKAEDRRNIRKHLVSAMTLSKMYCDHPDLIRESTSRTAKGLKITSKTSTKFNELMSIMSEIGEQKVVIFTQYAKMAEKLNTALIKQYKCTLITGGDKERQAKIEEFEHTTQVLICTDVLGYGINLQFASCVINYDLPWNPAVLEQRKARVHRMGQKESVNIINLIIEDEDKIEQRIRDVLYLKTNLHEMIIEGNFE